jgi:phosphatidylserine/phosphatidylglycerophosphate/cardiolipin synthase-like enzyme
MIAVDGEAARALAKIARHRWKLATNEEIPAPKSGGDPWPEELPVELRNVEVAVAVTSPPQDGHEAVRQVEQLYLDMIARAKKYIYIENQYFTSQRIGEALEARLADPDGPEIIVLTRLLSHGWLEEVTMTNLRTRLVRRLREKDTHGKLRVYYPHRGGLCEGTCIDLHSKVMIVDDEWLRIGSSNLSNRSMAVDTECDVTVEAKGDPEVKRVIRRFLNRLIAEHSLATLEEIERMGQEHGSLAALIDASPGPEDRCIRKLEAEELPEGVLSLASIGDMEKPISLDGLVQNLTPPGDPVPTRRGRMLLGGV